MIDDLKKSLKKGRMNKIKQRKKSIRKEIFSSIIIFSIIVLTLFIIAISSYEYTKSIDFAKNVIVEESKTVSARASSFFQDKNNTLNMIGLIIQQNYNKVDNQGIDDIYSLVSLLEKKNSEINRTFIVLDDDSKINDEEVKHQNSVLKQREFYTQTTLNGVVNYSWEVFDGQNGKLIPHFIISKSFDIDNVFQGIIALDCDLSSLNKSFMENSTFPSKSVFLASDKYKIAISNQYSAISQQLISENPDIFSSDSLTEFVKISGKSFLLHSVQVKNFDWNIINRIDKSAILTPFYLRMLFIFIGLTIIIIITSSLLSYLISKAIVEPVKEISTALNNLADGKTDITKIRIETENEIGLMAKSFNKYLDTTKELKADINDLRRTKDKLSYSLSLVNASIESTDDGMLIIDINNNIVKWNQKFLKLWGVVATDIENRSDSFMIEKIKDKIVDPERFLSTIKRATSNPQFNTFDILEFKNGKIIERYSSPQILNDKIVGRVWRYRDVTRLKEAEQSLLESEERYRIIFTQTTDAYCIIEKDKFIDVNEATLKIFSISRDEIIGKSPLDLSPTYQPNGNLSSELVKDKLETAYKKGRLDFLWYHKRGENSLFPSKISLVRVTLSGKELILVIIKDITEKLEMKEQLTQSEENFRLFFESMKDLVFITDLSGNINHNNRCVNDKLKYSDSELKSLSLFNLYSGLNETTKSIIVDEIRKGKQSSLTLPLKTRAGNLLMVESQLRLGSWNGKECLFALCKDVTNEKEALVKFNKIFTSNPNLLVISSHPDKIIMEVNQTFLRTFDLEAEQIIGMREEELALNANFEGYNEAFTKIFESNSISNHSMNVQTIKGKNIELLVSGELIETDWNKFYLTVMTDITNIKRLHFRLKESELKYKQLFDNMTNAFALHEMVYDEEGNPIDYIFLDINPAFERMTGLKREDVIGKRILQKIPTTEFYWITTYGKVAMTGASINYEQYAQAFDKYFEVRAFSPEKDKFAVIFSDITSRVKALKDLEKEKELAMTATQTKSEFLANMSHEIRTPLNGIIGFTDLLLNTELTPNQQQFVANANISGKALLGIINDILDFSKIEAGKMDIEVVMTSLSEIIEQAIDIIKFSACKKGLEVIHNVPVDFPIKAQVDPLRLKQIILNLLNNAVKFTNKGEIELKVEFEQINNQGKFTFRVIDTGIGISESSSRKLFRAFSQADGSITRRYGGTGLGLVISNYLATEMGSKISFKSVEGKGSEFYFEIVTEYIAPKTSDKNIFDSEEVLYASSNEKYLHVISNKLVYCGLKVTSVGSWQTLKKKVNEHVYRMIIIDENIINNNFDEFSEMIHNGSKINLDSLLIIYCPSNKTMIRFEQTESIKKSITKPIILSELLSQIKAILNYNDENKITKKVVKETLEKIDVKEKITILIAEDVEMNLLLIKTLIKKIVTNVEIITAVNGMEAVAKFKENKIDLILMDIQMPGLDGLEATRTIRAIEKEIHNGNNSVPIVALTAGVFEKDREKCLAVGMVDFLVKPINIPELIKVLNRVLPLSKRKA